MRSRYGIPGGTPRRSTGGGVRAGKITALIVIGLCAAGAVKGLGGWSALVVVPIALALWSAVDPTERRKGVRR